MTQASSVLASAFSALRPAAPITSGRLTILPFTTTYGGGARYVLLPKAIARGRLAITEVSQGGSVPYLRAVNEGPWPVLIFDGEELLGAKQNRIVNATILVGVGESILPVSCVEHGRWSRRSAAFAAGNHASHPRLRREKELQVRNSLAQAEQRQRSEGLSQPERAGRYRSDQGAVWAEVERRSSEMGVRSRTGAMADAYQDRADDLDAAVAAFLRPQSAEGVDASGDEGAQGVPVEGMVAVAAFLGDAFLCFDALWPAKRFAELYPKLLRGYALEALYAKRAAAAPPNDPEAEALRLFADLAEARPSERPGVDLGRDLRVETKSAVAAGLALEKQLVQLSVFPR
jgi:hypothetical protein